VVLATGCRIGDDASIAALDRAPAATRRSIVVRGAASMPPAEALAERAFHRIAECAVPTSEDLRLAVWAGMTPREAGWEHLAPEMRARNLEALVRAGVPRNPSELLVFADHQLAPEDRTALVAAWCAHRVFGHRAQEYQLVAALDPATALTAMAHVLARGPVVKVVAHT
jgi:hypothetical protein